MGNLWCCKVMLLHKGGAVSCRLIWLCAVVRTSLVALLLYIFYLLGIYYSFSSMIISISYCEKVQHLSDKFSALSLISYIKHLCGWDFCLIKSQQTNTIFCNFTYVVNPALTGYECYNNIFITFMLLLSIRHNSYC